jgi:hypothetical protein
MQVGIAFFISIYQHLSKYILPEEIIICVSMAELSVLEELF